MVAPCSHVIAYRNRTGSRAAFHQLRIGLTTLWTKDAVSPPRSKPYCLKPMPCLTLVELPRLLQNLQARLRQTEQTPVVCIHCAYASTTCTHHRRQHFAVAKTGNLVAASQSEYLIVSYCCSQYSPLNTAFSLALLQPCMR